MSECTKYKSTLKVVVLALAVIFTIYMLFCRGWVKRVEITEQELNSTFEKINLLDFSNLCIANTIHIKGEEYTVVYHETNKSFNIRVSSISNKSLSFSICKKSDFQFDFDFYGTISSESEFKKEIKSEFGSIDLFYNLFSREVSTEKGTVYFSPVSRVRSEIYSFTGEKNISGLLTTDKYIVGFICTSRNGDMDLLFDFLDYLIEK